LLVLGGIVLVLVLVMDGVWLLQQRDQLRDRETDRLMQGLDLIGELSVDALLRHDYTDVSRLYRNWAEGEEGVLALRAVAPNGFSLLQFEKEASAKATQSLSRKIRTPERILLDLELVVRTDVGDSFWTTMVYRHLLLAFALSVVLSFLLWVSVRLVALRPMEKLMEQIEELNTSLETRVRNRTAELEAVNARLEKEMDEHVLTEKRLEEAAARAQEERARSEGILAAIGDGISIQDRDFRVLYQNDAHRRMIGDHVGELCYQGYEHRKAICDGCPVAETFRDGEVHTAERFVERSDGRFWVEITTSALRDAQGRVIAGVEKVRDVTARKKTRQLIRSIVEGTVETGGTGFLRLLVRHFAEALDYRFGMIVEADPEKPGVVERLTYWSGSYSKEERAIDGTMTACGQALKRGEVVQIEEGVRDRFPRDDLLREMGAESFLGIPLRDPAGGVLGVLAVFDDRPRPPLGSHETDVQQIFAARAADELTRKRISKEKDQLQIQLYHSQKMDSIGRLAGGIAHDFNNLLSTIIGYGELALMDFDEAEPIRENLEFILSASEKAAGLTRQLLAFSRRQVMELRPLQLQRSVDELARMLGRIIGEKINFRVEPSVELPTVLADRGQVEQVLMNLAINAKDAMPRGGIFSVGLESVRLDGDEAVRRELEPGSFVRVTVSDTGTGMSEEVQARIFEPFFTTKNVGEGTGLGLSMVYGIMKQHRGHVEVHSVPGEGARFTLYFPVSGLEAAAEPERSVETGLCTGTETVVVVDDDPSVRRLVLECLNVLGYRAIEAETGEAVCEMAEKGDPPFDLLLTDLIMPGMNGRDLAAAVRSVRPEVCVIFMSGYVDVDLIDGASPVGGNSLFLQKPLTPGKIARAVRTVLDSRDEVC